MEYKNTIITPKTDFPMRAGLPQREPGMLEHWNKIDVYRLMLEKNEAQGLHRPLPCDARLLHALCSRLGQPRHAH